MPLLPTPPPWSSFSLRCRNWINGLRTGSCLGLIVLSGIDCDDEVDPHFVLKADTNPSSPLRNGHQRANLFPCVLTEDEPIAFAEAIWESVKAVSTTRGVFQRVCSHAEALSFEGISFLLTMYVPVGWCMWKDGTYRTAGMPASS